MHKKNNIVIFNLIFWSAYFLYEWIGQGSVEDQFTRSFINAWMVIPTAFLTTYLSIHILFEKLYRKDKHLEFWIGQALIAVIFVLIRRTFNYYYTYPMYYPLGRELQSFIFWPKLLIEFVNLYLIVSLYGGIYVMRNWFKDLQLVQELRQEKTNAELALLKSQIQPHFIFNTLNSVYSHAQINCPETADQILKISQLLEFNLYDSHKEMVPFNHNLTYIKNYIDLQKLRFGDKLDVVINHYDDTEGILIPNLLFLPLIENCFKHGVSTSTSHAWIRIDIQVQNNNLIVKIENSIQENNSIQINKSGLGHNNIKRRLELLYPDLHEYQVYKEKNTYLVIVRIKNIKQ